MATQIATEETAKASKRKSKKKEIYRVSDEVDDARLCEVSRVWHALFNKHFADFNGFDMNLDAAFALDWLGKIDAFERHETDETIVDGIEQKTADLAAEVKATRDVVDDLEYYTEKAFPDNGRIMLEFGFVRLRWGLSGGDGRWMVPAYTMRRIVQDYMAELTTAGLPANFITVFNTALDKLGLAEVDQEYEKRLRIKATTQRIKMFNTLYGIHTRVRDVARIVFRENPVVAKQFDL